MSPLEVVSVSFQNVGVVECEKSILQKITLLKNPLPGDVVLDQGFIIQEAAGMFCGEVSSHPLAVERNTRVKWRSILHSNFPVSEFMSKGLFVW